jgi:hypothetical protein
VSCRVGAQSVSVRVSGSVGLSPGDAVWLRWAKGAEHYFDDDGMRVDTEPREMASTLPA